MTIGIFALGVYLTIGGLLIAVVEENSYRWSLACIWGWPVLLFIAIVVKKRHRLIWRTMKRAR